MSHFSRTFCYGNARTFEFHESIDVTHEREYIFISVFGKIPIGFVNTQKCECLVCVEAFECGTLFLLIWIFAER